MRQPILYRFVLAKPPGYKVFSEPETIHYKKIIKFVLNTITFYLENDNVEEVDFNGETLTFTLQLVKIYFFFFQKNFQKIKVVLTVLVVETNLIQKNSWRDIFY